MREQVILFSYIMSPCIIIYIKTYGSGKKNQFKKNTTIWYIRIEDTIVYKDKFLQ